MANQFALSFSVALVRNMRLAEDLRMRFRHRCTYSTKDYEDGGEKVKVPLF